MTGLDCSVSTCYYNEDKCCCRSEIQVNGDSADKNDDTCCGSFKKQSSETTNSSKTPNPELSVGCDALNCVYNEDKICNADHIDISGHSADKSEQTLCSTFSQV